MRYIAGSITANMRAVTYACASRKVLLNTLMASCTADTSPTNSAIVAIRARRPPAVRRTLIISATPMIRGSTYSSDTPVLAMSRSTATKLTVATARNLPATMATPGTGVMIRHSSELRSFSPAPASMAVYMPPATAHTTTKNGTIIPKSRPASCSRGVMSRCCRTKGWSSSSDRPRSARRMATS